MIEILRLDRDTNRYIFNVNFVKCVFIIFVQSKQNHETDIKDDRCAYCSVSSYGPRFQGNGTIKTTTIVTLEPKTERKTIRTYPIKVIIIRNNVLTESWYYHRKNN